MDATLQLLALGAAMGNEKILAKLAAIDPLAFSVRLRALRAAIVAKDKTKVKELLKKDGLPGGENTILGNLIAALTTAGKKAKNRSLAEKISIAAKICEPEEFQKQFEKMVGCRGESELDTETGRAPVPPRNNESK